MPTPYDQLHAQLMEADRQRSRVLSRYEDRLGIGARANRAARRDPDYVQAQDNYDAIRTRMGRRADRGPADLARRFRF